MQKGPKRRNFHFVSDQSWCNVYTKCNKCEQVRLLPVKFMAVSSLQSVPGSSTLEAAICRHCCAGASVEHRETSKYLNYPRYDANFMTGDKLQLITHLFPGFSLSIAQFCLRSRDIYASLHFE